MDIVYLHKGKFKKGRQGESLIIRAAYEYCRETDTCANSLNENIARSAKGKPYFRDGIPNFSVSHSENIWMCMFSEKNCGLDIQVVKKCSFEAISKRYFTKDEIDYVKKFGLAGFFDIWVRKEAFWKFTGDGLFGETPDLIDDTGKLIRRITYKGKQVYVKPVCISEEVKGACCSLEEGDVEVRNLI